MIASKIEKYAAKTNQSSKGKKSFTPQNYK
jgi:hypothetical protein